MTVKAAREIASMGLTVDEATDILAGLHGDDFYRTEDASIDETTLYVFAPDFEEGALWIRLIIVDGLVVISFHPARHDL